MDILQEKMKEKNLKNHQKITKNGEIGIFGFFAKEKLGKN